MSTVLAFFSPVLLKPEMELKSCDRSGLDEAVIGGGDAGGPAIIGGGGGGAGGPSDVVDIWEVSLPTGVVGVGGGCGELGLS